MTKGANHVPATLREFIALADQALGLADVEPRDRLIALASCAR
ncbi:MAG: hypothetical protein ACRDS0_14040 [Pseudonocardiaceae bacterium]